MKDSIRFALSHPLESMKAKVKQIMVDIDHESPPKGSDIEDFPKLPIAEASRLIKSGQPLTDGVRFEDWPRSAQKEITGGKVIHPDGRNPEHPNV